MEIQETLEYKTEKTQENEFFNLKFLQFSKKSQFVAIFSRNFEKIKNLSKCFKYS